MDNFQSNKYRFSSAKPLILISDNIIEERNKQVNNFTMELIKYKVLLRDLIKEDISYSTRNELLNIAMFVSTNFELYDEFIKNEDIPIDELNKETKVDKKFIEKYREYIIAYILIFGNPTYKNIQDYIQIEENSDADDELGQDIIKYEEAFGVNGIVLGKNKKNAIIVTSLGEFKKVKLEQDVNKGEEIKGKEKKTLKDYKLYVSIISIFVLVFILSIVYKYNSVNSTIVVNTTSAIRLEINGFNRVLNVSSATEKGKVLIDETNILDKDIDTAIYKIIKYANENDMIKSTGVVVTITGKELKHNVLKDTEEYIYKKDLKVRFNNAGSEHKIN